MPILIFMKNPPVTLAAKGSLDKKALKQIRKLRDCVALEMIDNMKAVIFSEGNIAYIKEVTDEHLKKMEDEREKAKKGPQIQEPKMMFPSGRRGRG